MSAQIEAAFLMTLAEHGVAPDVQELLVRSGALRAAIAIIRPAVLEEAAGRCDQLWKNEPDDIDERNWWSALDRAAAAIRALKEDGK